VVEALSWQDIAVNARRFAQRWAGEKRERAEKDTFWNEFLDVLGINRRQVARFEAVAQRYSTGRIGFVDMLWPGRLLAEHKSAGDDLDKAMGQAKDYLPNMDATDVPRLLVICDFNHWVVEDLDAGVTRKFDLAQLSDNLDLFGFLVGRDRHKSDANETDVNLTATGLLTTVGDELQASGYADHARRVLLSRLLFCLFADDAQVWPRGLFEDFLLLRTRSDGSDLGAQLDSLFTVLNTPVDWRQRNLPEELIDFTYINGGIFSERLDVAYCNPTTRVALLAASRFNWSKISPAIFGSMFQDALEPAHQRRLGQHYTSEKNILRTIGPLFLDDLRGELARARTLIALREFRTKLATLTFFDPACGCGNFLVIAYRELRRLELECLRKIAATTTREGTGGDVLDIGLVSAVGIGQFYGIEIEEWPAQIAETAMHLTDHLANLELSAELGRYYARFPITATAHILTTNAITADWALFLPAAQCSYLFGNPPFVGMAWMSDDQQADNRVAFGDLAAAPRRTGRLDYVASWYARALLYAQHSSTRMAFVSTNSITQGEQARALGPLLSAYQFTIDFAHHTFRWLSDARGAAHVHVVIIGFAGPSAAVRSRRLFDYPDLAGDPVERKASQINVYLADAGPIVLSKTDEPPAGLPRMVQGSKPWDGKHLLVSEGQIAEVRADPIAARYLRPYKQTTELLYNKSRWCLWLVDAAPSDLRISAILHDRLAAVRAEREASRTPSVRDAAATPGLFTQRRQPSGTYLALPEVSSEHRDYIPAAYQSADIIAGNKLLTLTDCPLWLFGILQSAMWMSWADSFAGRLESRYSLSPALVYNVFPFSVLTTAERARVEKVAKSVLESRERYPSQTLADLYNPDGMPLDLRRAHRALDRVVDGQYGLTRPTNADRLAALIEAYSDSRQRSPLNQR
jgi:hypothetical protein